MNKEYLLILPNVFIGSPFIIGKITFQNFGSDEESIAEENKDLLLNVQQMMINNGFSGLFTYSYFASDKKFDKIVLDVRKAMALFRYITFEKHPDLSLESLTYYLLVPMKMELDTPEMKYSFEGTEDGYRYIHFWAPGFREVISETSSPQILHLDNEHFLIQKFNTGELKDKDKYIIAIERFNRTFKYNHDSVEDILNLTTAFEHIFEKSDTAILFAKNLIQTFRLENTTLAKFFTNWSKEFYKVRGEISHGNAFNKYSKMEGYIHWEECFKWKHPDGTIRYISHTSIAKKIFQLVIERLLKGDKIKNNEIADASLEEKEFLKQLEYKLSELKIEPLITPNEIHYRQLKELVDSNVPFGEPYYDLISKLKGCDGTEDKSVLFELLKYFLNITKDKFPDLEEECNEINALVTKNKNTALVGLKVFNLFKKIERIESNRKVFDDEGFYNFHLSQFFKKLYHSLSHIAWSEKIRN
jgi:hypothetical protein